MIRFCVRNRNAPGHYTSEGVLARGLGYVASSGCHTASEGDSNAARSRSSHIGEMRVALIVSLQIGDK